ncbi:hypothetical protein JXJ21_20820 [candidate division KSB1 bacterium]|nr:hypothetical protein [candidate division KSB1 bacterium]
MSYFCNEKIDFEKHNTAVRLLKDAFLRQAHSRIPVVITGSIRNLLSNPAINSTGFSFKDFFTDATAQLICQLEFQHYVRHHWLCDQEMGLPEKGWQLALDFQNSYDQAWFGCPIRFFGSADVPDTQEILKDNPQQLYHWEDLDPFWGRGSFMQRAMDIYLKIKKMCDSGYEFHGLPVAPPVKFPCIATDGLFTIALKLRGAVEIMTDMYENPGYYHDLLDYITRNLIARIKAHREWWWQHDSACTANPNHRGAFGYADDAIAMLSPAQFKEFVLPYMKRLFDAFYDGSGCDIHLCGDATHHFKFLADEFNVKSFDTGFPVNHGALRRELGPSIQINGGSPVMLLKDGSPKQIAAETKRICESGVMSGKRFILIAANNLAPCTPIENISAFYQAGKKYGKYE